MPVASDRAYSQTQMSNFIPQNEFLDSRHKADHLRQTVLEKDHQEEYSTTGEEAATRAYEIPTPISPVRSPPIPVPKRSLSSTPQTTRAAAPIAIDEASEMLEAAFMFAIASPRRALPKGMSVASKESFKHLAEIAPSVFKPGCADALAARSVFLPTLTHALSNVGGTRAKSMVLQTKVSQLSHAWGAAPPEHTSVDAQNSRGTSLATRLWQMTQRAILRERKTAPLPPLSQAGKEWTCLEFDDIASPVAESDRLDLASDSSEIALEDQVSTAATVDATWLSDDLDVLSDTFSPAGEADGGDDVFPRTDSCDMLVEDAESSCNDDLFWGSEADSGHIMVITPDDVGWHGDSLGQLALTRSRDLDDGDDDMLDI